MKTFEESLILQRMVIDYVKANEYKSFNMPVTSDLLKSVRTSHNRYSQSLDEKINTKVKSDRQQKLVPINGKVLALNKIVQPEEQSKLDLLSKSNALKTAAPDK